MCHCVTSVLLFAAFALESELSTLQLQTKSTAAALRSRRIVALTDIPWLKFTHFLRESLSLRNVPNVQITWTMVTNKAVFDGVTVAKPKRSAYEQSKYEARTGKVKSFDNLADFFADLNS